MATTDTRLTVYGADWCEVTARTRKQLDSLGVEYRYVDIEQDPSASAWVKEQNAGMEIKPTLDMGGQVLTAPSREDLEAALRRHGFLQ